MQIKKSFLVFVLLLPISITGEWSIASNRNNSSLPLIEKFKIASAEGSSELPKLQLLQAALSGYELLKEEKIIIRPEIITIIDYSLPSDKKRLWVLDLSKTEVLYNCLVAHGRNSGERTAEYFSNKPGSYASSPGFYTTGETYFGKHGFSLRLDGIERGINDKARERAIVIHGADYVSPDFVKKYGRLGRSLGCPAVPEALSKEIIETIKGGSCLFVFAPSEDYLSNSEIIHKLAPVKKG